MTRGKFFLITTKNQVFNSLEFNGDMYPGGHYEDAVEMLKKVEGVNDFKKMIFDFDKGRFDYQATEEDEDMMKEVNLETAGWLNLDGKIVMLKEVYYDHFFSDYLFWKNVSKSWIWFLTKKGSIHLKPGDIMTFNYGEVEEIYEKGGEKYGKIKRDVTKLSK